MRGRVVLPALALVGVAPLVFAQQPQPIGRPTAEYAEPFSRLTGVRELADGRVIVSDSRDKIVQLLDLRTGQARAISREGSGPGEYALPSALYAMPNDQTLLVDLQNRRFLMIGPDGRPGATHSPPNPTPAQGPGGQPIMIGGLINPRGVDRQGRLYFQDLGIRPGAESPDSVAILRWAPGTTRIDTAGFVRGPRTQVTTTGGGGAGGGGGMRIAVGGQVVWSPVDAWGVAGDGSVARVTPEPYRVTWYGAGRRATAGPVVPYTPIRVTEADKEEYRATLRANPPTVIAFSTGPGGGGATPAAPQLPEPTFAETKPAFSGTNAALVTPEGEVWVLRTRRAGDRIPVYDIFDSSGRLARKVSLAAGSRVVGFGPATVYVVRTDEDDLEYLQRYSRPVSGQP